MKLSTIAKGFQRDRVERQKRKVAIPDQEAIEQRLWDVRSEPQKMALESEASEILFGGSAGGGKSAILLILATRYHRRSIIFRREYPILKGMIEKSKECLNGIAKYNSTEKLWRGIPGDRTLEFGAIQREDDKENYRGRDHDLKAWDELTEFTESQYIFANGWCRTTIPGQRARIIATCNPPSNSRGRWIIKRWAPWLDKQHPNPAEPGELRWYAMLDGVDTEVDSGEPIVHTTESGQSEIIEPRSRTFIPATLNDNEFLRDGSYRSLLQGLPEPLRSQMLYGDFSIKETDIEWQLIPSTWVRAAQARWLDRSNYGYDVLGVDVARGGKDKTVIAPRYMFWIDNLRVYPGADTPDGDAVADLVVEVMGNKSTPINIDVVGVGSSPYDELKRRGFNVRGINGAATPLDDDGEPLKDRTEVLGFYNYRSYIWWHLRELLDPKHGDMIELPNSETLFGDLTALRWSVEQVKDSTAGLKGLIRVQSKNDKELLERLGRSPDEGDAVAYAFAEIKDEIDSDADWLIDRAFPQLQSWDS